MRAKDEPGRCGKQEAARYLESYGFDPRPSAFQAGRIPSHYGLCERYVHHALLPVVVALRSQSCLRLEGRARTLSGPSPALSPARVHAHSAWVPGFTDPLTAGSGGDTHMSRTTAGHDLRHVATGRQVPGVV